MALTQWHEIRGKMSVALEVGVEAALLLEDIYYWVNHNRDGAVRSAISNTPGSVGYVDAPYADDSVNGLTKCEEG